jgi:hypothetical protein
MGKLLVERWTSMSGGEKAGVKSFLAAEEAKYEIGSSRELHDNKTMR